MANVNPKAGGATPAVKLSMRPAGDVGREQIHLKVLIHGMSGAGKTHFAAGARDVAVCLVEAQGFGTIRDNHPHAIVPGVEGADGVPRLRDMREVREFFSLAARGVLAEHGIRSIVIDSITEIQRMMIDEIMQGKAQPGAVFTKADYGTLGTKMQAFLRMVRDLPYHVIGVCLTDWQQEEGTGRRILAPLVKGSIQKEISGYFHVTGYAYRRQDDDAKDGVGRYIMVDGDDRYTCKPYGPLKGVLAPDFNLWLEAIAKNEPLATLDGAPLPTTSMSGERVTRVRFGNDE